MQSAQFAISRRVTLSAEVLFCPTRKSIVSMIILSEKMHIERALRLPTYNNLYSYIILI